VKILMDYAMPQSGKKDRFNDRLVDDWRACGFALGR
jgi:hypothetical protein